MTFGLRYLNSVDRSPSTRTHEWTTSLAGFAAYPTISPTSAGNFVVHACARRRTPRQTPRQKRVPANLRPRFDPPCRRTSASDPRTRRATPLPCPGRRALWPRTRPPAASRSVRGDPRRRRRPRKRPHVRHRVRQHGVGLHLARVQIHDHRACPRVRVRVDAAVAAVPRRAEDQRVFGVVRVFARGSPTRKSPSTRTPTQPPSGSNPAPRNRRHSARPSPLCRDTSAPFGARAMI